MNKEALDASLKTAEFLVQIFALLVAVGIVGEVGFGLRTWILGKQLQRIERAEDQQRQAEIARLRKETAALNNENLKLRTAVMPRIFAIDESEQGKTLGEERLAEVKKYAGTVALIQPVPDFEAYQLAVHIATGLRSAGWNASLMDESQSHIGPGLFWSGVKVVTLEQWPFTPEGIPFAPELSKAAHAAMAIVALWDLTLGPPFGPQFFGIHWDREFKEKPLLTARGFKFPPGGVVILVGMRPIEDSILSTPPTKKE